MSGFQNKKERERMKEGGAVSCNVRNRHSISAHSSEICPSRPPKSDEGPILEVNLIDCMKGWISYRTQLVGEGGSGNHPRITVDSSPCQAE